MMFSMFTACQSEHKSVRICTDKYPEQTRSKYILPYPTGVSYSVGQGNCTDGSHSDDQNYAYDFDMPIGSVIIASRSGTVTAIEERYMDGNRIPGQENYLTIQHDDGSVSGYYHLTKNGVLVELNSYVNQGDTIALSGDTGDSSEAHLHFEVLECANCNTIPVSFRNTRKHTKGLVENEHYKAL